MKIVSVVGNRPQFVKAAAVSRAMVAHGGLDEVLVHTGQHYDHNMSEAFFDELKLPAPRHHLEVGSAPHGAQTARTLERMEDTLLHEQPSVVLLYGDTNSTLAGALAAVKLHIPVAHVEAGLRSFNRRMPEEINRIVTDNISDVLYAPTREAVANLAAAGVPDVRVVLSGDVMYDVCLMAREIAGQEDAILQRLEIANDGYYLATIHRAENTDDGAVLARLVDVLSRVADKIPVVLPLHPRTQAALAREGLADEFASALHLVEPLGYFDFVRLEMGARAIATDSGGVQKEAYFHGRPCFTLRTETEWVELIELGWNRLVPPGEVEDMVQTLLDLTGFEMREGTPYGDGRAAERIVLDLAARYG